jgi:spoIIIJ-associated protein
MQMEWVEITAKTVDAAKERALDELGIHADEAEFEVLEEPRRGLFGQTRGTARVRARVAPRTPRAKVDRRSRRGRADSGGGDAPKKSRSGRSDKRQAAKDTSEADDAPPSDGREPDSDGDRSRSSAAATPTRTKKSSKSTTAAKSIRSKQPAKQEGKDMTMTLDEQVAATESFLTGLLDAIGFEGEVTTERTDDANAHVNIEGDDLGLLIGPRGQTMNAIQDLARITLQKQAGGSWEGHVHVDVNGYRAKRRAALVAFVEKVAADVLESGTAKALEPMASSDRKVVHDTVNGIDGVHTTSEGHEPRRWVMISPDQD